MFREVMAVARANGVELAPHPAWRFNMEIFAQGSFAEAVDSLVNAGERAAKGGYTHIIPSMLQDVLAGKQTEIEETVGYVVAEGRRLGRKLHSVGPGHSRNRDGTGRTP